MKTLSTTLTTNGLQEALRGLDDPGRAQGRMHAIDIVVLTAIMGIMSGCYGYRAMECIKG